MMERNLNPLEKRRRQRKSNNFLLMSFADKLSITRIILIPIFISLLLYSKSFPFLKKIAIGVFILAILSDFLDGLVARIKKEKSSIGVVLDPLADKLLLLSAFITLYFLKFNLPLWLVLIVVSRDFLILLGIVILTFLKIEVSISPSLWGKLTTFFQMITILVVLSDFSLFVKIFWILTAIFTLISGVDYLRRGIKALNQR